MLSGQVSLKLLGVIMLACMACNRPSTIGEASASFQAALPQGAFVGDSDSARASFAKADTLNTYIGRGFGEEALGPTRGDSIVYRFFWLRSFDHPMVFTLMVGRDHRLLVWKELAGQGGYHWGEVSCSGSVELLPAEFSRFVDLLERCDFYDMSASGHERGLDGAEWLLESASNHYHYVSRWSGGGTPFGDCCLYLIELAGLRQSVGDIY